MQTFLPPAPAYRHQRARLSSTVALPYVLSFCCRRWCCTSCIWPYCIITSVFFLFSFLLLCCCCLYNNCSFNSVTFLPHLFCWLKGELHFMCARVCVYILQLSFQCSSLYIDSPPLLLTINLHRSRVAAHVIAVTWFCRDFQCCLLIRFFSQVLSCLLLFCIDSWFVFSFNSRKLITVNVFYWFFEVCFTDKLRAHRKVLKN